MNMHIVQEEHVYKSKDLLIWILDGQVAECKIIEYYPFIDNYPTLLLANGRDYQSELVPASADRSPHLEPLCDNIGDTDNKGVLT